MGMEIKKVSDFRKAMRIGPYAWPGGYDVFFILSDSASLCYDCAKKNIRQMIEALSIDGSQESGWRPVGIDTTDWCEDTEYCSNCGKIIFEWNQ